MLFELGALSKKRNSSETLRTRLVEQLDWDSSRTMLCTCMNHI